MMGLMLLGQPSARLGDLSLAFGKPVSTPEEVRAALIFIVKDASLAEKPLFCR